MRRLSAWPAQFALLAAIWGSSFVCIKLLAEVWAPLHVALGRCALGLVALLLALAVRRERLPPPGRVWLHLAGVALLMNVAPFTLFAYCEQHVPSVVAGLWNATTPLLTLGVVLLVLREEEPDRRRVRGMLGGFAGAVCLLGPWRGLGGDELLGDLACLAGAGCYALGLPLTRRHLSGRPESGVSLAAGQLLLATAALAVASPLAGTPTLALGTDALAALLVLGALGSGLAYVLTHAVVRAAGPTTFSLVTYVIPVFSTTLGVVLLNEPLTWNEPVGAAVVLGAVWATTHRRAGDRRGAQGARPRSAPARSPRSAATAPGSPPGGR